MKRRAKKLHYGARPLKRETPIVGIVCAMLIAIGAWLVSWWVVPIAALIASAIWRGRVTLGELQAALKIEPNNASFRVMLAELYQQIGLRKRAETEAARALSAELIRHWPPNTPRCSSSRKVADGMITDLQELPHLLSLLRPDSSASDDLLDWSVLLA